MSIDTHQITVGGVRVSVVRKAIKNLHLGVYPPDGRVRVAAPLAVNDEAVRSAVTEKLGWIKRRREAFKSQPRQSKREMVSGESHYFLGQRYRLRVIPQKGPGKVTLNGNAYLDLCVRSDTTADQRETVLRRWHREQLRELIPPLIEKWQPMLGVEVASWGIKRMKTKWGSCNMEASRIWLNLELAKKPVQCLEYVIVHEMVHLRERHHNDRFIELMDKTLPSWQLQRDELNSHPLAHELWIC